MPNSILPLASCVLCLIPALSLAQDKSPAFPIATVNVDKVFNSSKQHADRLAPLRVSAKELDEAVQIRQVEMETTANQLLKSTPGTPDQQRLQGQLNKLRIDLQVFLEQERQKLQKREVSALIATQKDVDETIKKLCKERGLKLVLRQYNPPEEGQPLQEVVKNLGRDVVYQDGLDITDDVIKALNEVKADGT